MLIYEFFGVPGCGKTTLCNSIAEQLRNLGYSVADINDVYFYKSGRGFLRKIRTIIRIILTFSKYKLYYEIFYFNRINNKDFNSLKYAFKLIFYYYQLNKFSNECKYDVVLLDEGLIQYLSSQGHDGVFINKDILSYIVQYMKESICEIKHIKCNIPLDMAVKRIRKRGTNTAKRFSTIENDEELLLLYNIREYNLNLIGSMYEDVVSVNFNSENYKIDILNKILTTLKAY